MYQIHVLKKVHADPHPGNFLVSNIDGSGVQLIALDFGCMKIIPDEFYTPYFNLAKPEHISNSKFFKNVLYELEILRTDDNNEEVKFFTAMFHEMLSLFTEPLHAEAFDFSDPEFFGRIAELGQKYSSNTELRKMNANRGSQHFIYMNHTFWFLQFNVRSKGKSY